LRLKVFRLVKSLGSTNPPHPWVTISTGETIGELCTKLADAVSPVKGTKSPYRVWNLKADLDDRTETEFLGSQLPASDAKIVEESDKSLEEDGIESDDAFVVEFKQPDGWIADAPKAVQTRVGPIENLLPLFNSNEGFFNRMSPLSPQRSADSYPRTVFYDRPTSSAFRSTSTAMTVVGNKSLIKTLEPGTLGLGNMSVQPRESEFPSANGNIS
jgi:ubiquitin carboxyl-terminal hydrolase 4/11/15